MSAARNRIRRPGHWQPSSRGHSRTSDSWGLSLGPILACFHRADPGILDLASCQGQPVSDPSIALEKDFLQAH